MHSFHKGTLQCSILLKQFSRLYSTTTCIYWYQNIKKYPHMTCTVVLWWMLEHISHEFFSQKHIHAKICWARFITFLCCPADFRTLYPITSACTCRDCHKVLRRRLKISKIVDTTWKCHGAYACWGNICTISRSADLVVFYFPVPQTLFRRFPR